MMPPCPPLDHALEEGAVVASAVSGRISASPERLDAAGTFMLAVTMAEVADLLAPGSLRLASVARSFPCPGPYCSRDQTGLRPQVAASPSNTRPRRLPDGGEPAAPPLVTVIIT